MNPIFESKYVERCVEFTCKHYGNVNIYGFYYQQDTRKYLLQELRDKNVWKKTNVVTMAEDNCQTLLLLY